MNQELDDERPGRAQVLPNYAALNGWPTPRPLRLAHSHGSWRWAGIVGLTIAFFILACTVVGFVVIVTESVRLLGHLFR